MGKKRGGSESFLTFHRRVLLESMRSVSWTLLLIIAIDLLFYALAVWVFHTSSSQIQMRYDALTIPQSLDSLSEGEIGSLTQGAKSFYWFLIEAIVATIGSIIVLWTLCKGLIWMLTLRQRITPSLLARFSLLSILWLSLWSALLWVLAMSLRLIEARFLLLLFAALFIVLTNSLYASFLRNPSKAGAILGLRQPFSQFKHTIFVYALLGFTLFAALSLTPRSDSLVISAISIGLLLTLIALMRTYASHLHSSLSTTLK